MKSTETPAGIIPDDLKADLEKLLANPKGGIQNPEQARKALERINAIREKNKALFGETDIAVQLIREARDH